jgi:hypothetical protein
VKTKTSKTILTTIILVMAVVQLPLFYYGIGLLIEVPYRLIGLILTIALLNSLINYRNTNSRYHIIGLIVIALLAFPTHFQRDAMENLDWKLQLNKRSKIVEQIRAGLLKPDEQGYCAIRDSTFLPVSNIENKVFISRNKSYLEVEFYIWSGSLDHYSALVYTDRELDMSRKDSNVTRHLDPHWYALHM